MLWQISDDNDWTENAIRNYNRLSPEALIKKLKNTKDVTPVTRKKKPSAIEQAIQKSHTYRESISTRAERSKKGERLEWREFAKEQVKWWDKLAQKLDGDT
jgi:hypothetical protein